MTQPVSQEDYEAALECAVRYLADPELAAGAGAEKFDACLAQIRAYRADLPAADEPAEDRSADDALIERLEAFQRERAARAPGDGIGPTLGMDLNGR